MGLGSSGGETCRIKNKSNFSKTSSIMATILVSFVIHFFFIFDVWIVPRLGIVEGKK